MFPPSFDYYRAATVPEALDLLAEHDGEDPALLAGGHSLLPEMKAGETTPGVVVDIGDVDALTGVEVDDRTSTVGALVTYADAADDDALGTHAPVIAEAAEHVGDVQIRNRGTVGGNLARADPTADLPAAVLAADATLLVRSRDGSREVPAASFFRGDGETALRDGELITGVRIPRVEGAGSAYVKKTHPATGYALVGVAAVVAVADGEVATARVAANGVTDPPRRLRSVEDALAGASPDDGDAVEAAGERAADDVDEGRLVGDVHASGEFRAELLPVYVERALGAAVECATDGDAANR